LSDLQPVLPELQPSSGGETIGYTRGDLGYDNMMGSNDGCGGEELFGQGGWKDYVTEEDTFTTKDGTVVKLYKVEIDGETIYVVQVGNEKPIAYGIMMDPKNKAIADGLNAGFADISNRGGDWSKINVSDLLNDVANFTNNNLSSWNQIYTGKDILFTFIKHATVGGAIKQAMKNDGTYGGDKGQYNMMIGFWTSYYVSENEKNGWDIKWDSKIKYNVDGTIDAKNSTFGIVDIARLMRAVMWKENFSGVFDNTKVNNGDYGLMQINKDSFINGFDDDGNVSNHKGILYTSPMLKKLGGFKNNESLWQTNIFGNIGAGIGILFNQTCRSNGDCYGSPSPSVWNWLNNNKGKSFIRGFNPESDTDVIKVRNLLTIITNEKYRFQEGAW
jgi:hypothetical protein